MKGRGQGLIGQVACSECHFSRLQRLGRNKLVNSFFSLALRFWWFSYCFIFLFDLFVSRSDRERRIIVSFVFFGTLDSLATRTCFFSYSRVCLLFRIFFKLYFYQARNLWRGGVDEFSIALRDDGWLQTVFFISSIERFSEQ